jgi:hypothetical protein
LQRETPTFLPGIGAAIAIPSETSQSSKLMQGVGVLGQHYSLLVSQLQPVLIGTAANGALASVAILLPQPVTRVRLAGAGLVVAYEGTKEVTRKSVNEKSNEVELLAGDDFIDRLLVMGTGQVLVSRICYDGSDLGWQRAGRRAWQESLNQSFEWMYREDAILPPGNYRLESTTAVQVGGAYPGNEWDKKTVSFRIGMPPGLQPANDHAAMYNGPLNEIASYVKTTIPAPGQRPVYRAYDVGVQFNVPYVDRMFLAAGQTLSIDVLDSNNQNRRSGARNWSGQSSELLLTNDERAWISILTAGRATCVQPDPAKIPRNQTLSIGGGELLGSAELHAGQLRAGELPASLFRFEFTTSKFADFLHHMASFDGRCRVLAAQANTGVNVELMQSIRTAQSALAARSDDYKAVLVKTQQPSPTQDDFDKLDAARTALEDARETLRSSRVQAFEQVWAGYFGVPKPDPPRVSGVEISCAVPPPGSQNPQIIIIESPEPMLWERILAKAAHASSIPRRRRTVVFDRVIFGSPDAETTFNYQDLIWTTDVELRVVNGAVEPRTSDQWTLTLVPWKAFAVEVTVEVALGGRAVLHGEGNAVTNDVSYVPAQDVTQTTLTLTGNEIRQVKLSGSGIRLLSVSVVEQHRPPLVVGSVRILRAMLPQSVTDTRHKVDLTTISDSDLSDWSIRWFDALAPTEAIHYHTFAPGSRLRDSEIARIYGGVDKSDPEPGVRVYAGGAIFPPSLRGAIFQLVNPAGQVMHEHALLAEFTEVDSSSFVHAVSDDGTRAAFIPIVPNMPTFEPRHWQLKLTMLRDAGADLPILSVGGNSLAEETTLAFTTE